MISSPVTCFGEIDVSEYPQLEYSKKDVVRAGDALKGQLVWSPESAADIRRVFSIANSWRASHAFPMHSLRAELQARMIALKLGGLTAARLKQMSSIRGKLTRIQSNLRQLQDLGGCRAVLPTIEGARNLVAATINNSRHTLKSEDHYMDTPRASGYRSHHLIFAFAPRNSAESGYEGRLIEIQIRSRLQHSWATAVEAVGLHRGENLKAGLGNVARIRCD
jgi:(p)ppGpp synthase/HD superfamily hydrolase